MEMLWKAVWTITHFETTVLGICLGMQLMCNKSAEGNTKGLGILMWM
jgi:imidazoleglycerol phosphate synthase glutamine amidotransferase subunit HisH